MLELPGQAALSSFRLAKLTRSLQRADERVAAVEARFTYFVSTSAAVSDKEKKRLNALLLSGEPVAKFTRGAKLLHVVPRPGTISPWSSKATDIVRACDIDAVDRVADLPMQRRVPAEVAFDQAVDAMEFAFDRALYGLLAHRQDDLLVAPMQGLLQLAQGCREQAAGDVYGAAGRAQQGMGRTARQFRY